MNSFRFASSVILGTLSVFLDKFILYFKEHCGAFWTRGWKDEEPSGVLWARVNHPEGCDFHFLKVSPEIVTLSTGLAEVLESSKISVQLP